MTFLSEITNEIPPPLHPFYRRLIFVDDIGKRAVFVFIRFIIILHSKPQGYNL